MISPLIRKILLPAALSFAGLACFAQNIEGGKSLTAPDDTTARSPEHISPQISPNNNMETNLNGENAFPIDMDSFNKQDSAPRLRLPEERNLLIGDLFGAKNLGLYATSSRNTYINLLDSRGVEFFLNYHNNNLSLHTGVVANQYETLGVKTQVGVSGALEYRFSPQWSVGVFGTVYNNNPYFSMAAFPFVESSSYGGWVKYEREKFGIKLGAKNYYDSFQRQWRMTPIFTPSIKFSNKFRLELPLGPLFQDSMERLLRKSPRSGPTIMPDGR